MKHWLDGDQIVLSLENGSDNIRIDAVHFPAFVKHLIVNLGTIMQPVTEMLESRHQEALASIEQQKTEAAQALAALKNMVDLKG